LRLQTRALERWIQDLEEVGGLLAIRKHGGITRAEIWSAIQTKEQDQGATYLRSASLYGLT
jgi:hypothetical protein